MYKDEISRATVRELLEQGSEFDYRSTPGCRRIVRTNHHHHHYQHHYHLHSHHHPHHYYYYDCHHQVTIRFIPLCPSTLLLFLLLLVLEDDGATCISTMQGAIDVIKLHLLFSTLVHFAGIYSTGSTQM